MKNLITAITIIFLLFDYSLAQAPDTLWTKAIGDTSNDAGASIVQKADGGFIVCGSKGTEIITDAYTTDIWIINTDENGNVINSNTYGGMESVEIIPTSDNGYMLLANTFTPQGNNFEDIILLKLNENGDTMWTKTINLMWSDYGREIHETLDSGFIILFRSTGNPNGIRLFRTNSLGDTLWTKIYNTSNGSAQITDDNGFVFLSYKDSTWVSKEDSSGNIEWIKSYHSEFRGSKIIKTNDPGYYIAGQTYPDPFGPPQDIGVMKINDNGDSLWFQSYPITNFNSLLGRVSKTSDDELIISGATSVDGSSFEDGLLLKVDANGILKWSKMIGGLDEEFLRDTHQLDNGTYVSVGRTASFGAGAWDLWLLKFTQDPTEVSKDFLTTVDDFELSQNYPNPFNPSTTIKFSLPSSGYATLKIYNALGEEVAVLMDNELTSGAYEVEWNASGLPSGVFFYQLKTEGFLETKKMLLLK
ncbi:T9SS type A sorting domain-containing protein [Bacteroidota bacterium]